MNRGGWLKAMTQFSNICGASPVKNQILFFDGHGSQFDNCARIKMTCKNIQPFVRKSGDSINDHNKDNCANSKLKSLYNVANIAWMLKYGTTNALPHNIKSVLVEAWDDFKMSAGNIIRGRFSKKSTPPPSALPT